MGRRAEVMPAEQQRGARPREEEDTGADVALSSAKRRRRDGESATAQDAVAAASAGDVELLRALQPREVLTSLTPQGRGSQRNSVAHLNGCGAVHASVLSGHCEVLRVLFELAGEPALKLRTTSGHTAACIAAGQGHDDCLRALSELGCRIDEALDGGWTPAHSAAQQNRADTLRTLKTLGASLTMAEVSNEGGWTPVHYAAARGNPDCIRAIAELEGTACLTAAVHTRVSSIGLFTPGHFAVANGRLSCLQALHECLSASLSPIIDGLVPYGRDFTNDLIIHGGDTETIVAAVEAMTVRKQLECKDSRNESPAGHAAQDGKCMQMHGAASQLSNLRYLHQIGGTQQLLERIMRNPLRHLKKYNIILSEPRYLGLHVKRSWLAARLREAANASFSGADNVSIVVHRDNIMHGLCAALGVDETTGQVVQGTRAGALDVAYLNENSSGDGLRRSFIEDVVKEMISIERGLFLTKDGGRTLQPNPNSKLAAGDDHLSHFGLLGRISGLALFHQEPINARWSSAFIKAVIGPPPQVFFAEGEFIWVKLPAVAGCVSPWWPGVVVHNPDTGRVTCGSVVDVSYNVAIFRLPPQVTDQLDEQDILSYFSGDFDRDEFTKIQEVANIYAASWTVGLLRSNPILCVATGQFATSELRTWGSSGSQRDIVFDQIKDEVAALELPMATASTTGIAGITNTVQCLKAWRYAMVMAHAIVCKLTDEEWVRQYSPTTNYSDRMKEAERVRRTPARVAQANAECALILGDAAPAPTAENEFVISADDLQSFDPDFYEKKVRYIREGIYASRDKMTLKDLDLLFVDEDNDEVYMRTATGEGLAVELKPGGAEIAVTEENKLEYLGLLAKHRLSGTSVYTLVH
eukprot:COSAG03_NODE_1179_length_4634_cov_2.694004_5_plen_867_part_00